MKAAYLVTCAVAALIAGGDGARAATAPTQAASTDQGAVATASDASGAPLAAPEGAQTQATQAPQTQASIAGSTGVQEVVVTAQRRRENIEKVPGTIQALTGQILSQLNVTSLEDLIKYTPNVTFANNGPGQGSIFMRGLSAGFAGGQSSATIANFPNVALYLDDQSMQFPARNVDIYAVDLERVEVLEGPQGTLFGGGAEAGAVRYITNKPKLDHFEGDAEAGYGYTAHGGSNALGHVTLNVPLIQDKFAIRAVLYDDRHGGYIENVPSTFTRSNADLGNYYFNIKPTAGRCPNGLTPGAAGLCTLPGQQSVNNSALAGSDTNPLTYTGGRFEALYQINDDWNILITESLQSLDAEGSFNDYPVGDDFQNLKPLQVTNFAPTYDHDNFENTAWTVNGKIAGLNAIYTGAYLTRNISNQEDYTNYSRTGGGIYYECTGGTGGLFGAGKPQTCYSPVGYWRDKVRNTHLSNEARLSTPDSWRLRGLVGVYYEQFRIHDDMNFDYKTIPSCNTANLATALAGGATCVANVATAPNSTANDPGVRGDNTAFGEDTQRGYDQTAVFASLDFDIIPHVLTVSGGTRYFDYNEFEVGSQYGTGGGCVDVPNGQCVGGTVNIDAANDKVTYTGFKSRAVLTWNVTSRTTAYYLFSQGFRPGGFNRSVSAVAPGPGGAQFEKPNGYAPDSLTNNEIGVKTQLFDRRLQVNLSAYDMDWDNVQFGFYNPTELGNTTFGTNGPDYNIKGVEAQFVARLTPQLTLQGSTSYNHATQSSSPCLVDNISTSPGYNKCITEIIPKGSTTAVPFENPFGALGTVPAFSPTWEANLRARYEFNIYDYHAFAQLAGTYMDSMYNQPATYTPGAGVLIPSTTQLRYLQPAYVTADASIGATYGRYRAEVDASNLLDSHATTFTSSAQFIKSEVPLRPRVVMLKIGASF